jgi:hypothetical protein
MNRTFANCMKMCKGNGNTTALLFSLKGLEILHGGRRGQVKTIVMEHFNSILFHMSGPANKQHDIIKIFQFTVKLIEGKANNKYYGKLKYMKQ